jgi:CheY-like chemotaxis protein
MPIEQSNFLVVDDDVLIRTSLSHILTELGHSVRSAEDGFSALCEIRQEIPDILLSDLYMPGMSGFELLSIVRRRFPAIQVIAMSSAFSAGAIPPGIAADAFYEKATNLASLLKIVEAMTHPQRQPSLRDPRTLTPIWIQRNGHDPSGKEYVMIICPECLRTFPQFLEHAQHTVQETGCVYCYSLIHYAIVPPTTSTSASKQMVERTLDARTPKPLNVSGLNDESTKKELSPCAA